MGSWLHRAGDLQPLHIMLTRGGTWSFEDITRDRRGATGGTITSVTGHVCFKGTADMAEEVRTTFGNKRLQKIHAQLPRYQNAAQNTAYIKTLHEFRSTCVADGAREVYYTHYSTVEKGESVLSRLVVPLSGSAADLWGTQPTLQLMASSTRTIKLLTSFDPSRYACEARRSPSQRLCVCVDGESALSGGAGSVISQLHGLKAFTVLATFGQGPSDEGYVLPMGIHVIRLSIFLIPRAAQYISTELEGLTLTTHFDLRAPRYSSNRLRELSCTLYQTGEEGKLAVARRVRCIVVELSHDGPFPFNDTEGKRGFCDALCAEAAKALAAFPRVESVRVKPSDWAWDLVHEFHAAAEQAKVRCDHEDSVMRLTRAPVHTPT